MPRISSAARYDRVGGWGSCVGRRIHHRAVGVGGPVKAEEKMSADSKEFWIGLGGVGKSDFFVAILV